jgi:hypothetical protein
LRYRPPLPPVFVDRLAERCGLDGAALLAVEPSGELTEQLVAEALVGRLG